MAMRKPKLTKMADQKIIRFAKNAQKRALAGKVSAARDILAAYITDINQMLKKDSYTPDDAILLIVKTDMCLEASKQLLHLVSGKNAYECMSEEERGKIARFRSLRAISTAHPLNTTCGGETGFGKNGTEWFVDIGLYGRVAKAFQNTKWGFYDDASYPEEDPDFVMTVYSEDSDQRHLNRIYVEHDIIEPLNIALDILKKNL